MTTELRIEKLDKKLTELANRRDCGLLSYQIAIILMLISVTITNVIVTAMNGDGKPGGPDTGITQETGSALIENLNSIVGNDLLFFVEFCVLFSFKIITMVLLAVGVNRYIKARSYRKKNNRLEVRGYHLS